jgi:hypothetical protein
VAVSTVQGEGMDYHLGFFAALCVLYAYAMLREVVSGADPSTAAHAPAPPAVVEGPASRPLVLLALVYAFGLPMLGLQEKAGCLMFSQLRLHAGSNHYMLPTSLLQRALADSEPSSAFAGGVVRVEATDLSWVGNTFAQHMGERTLRLVRELAGVRGEYVWAAKATSAQRAQPPPRFLRHTLSNLGLRRLLATASRQRDTFWMRYTRLNGTVGDEAWRTASEGESYMVRGEGGRITCARIGWGGLESACSEREVALLAEPQGVLTNALTYFLCRLPRPNAVAAECRQLTGPWASIRGWAIIRIPQPNPIVPGMSEEMHCVTWG